MRNTLANLPPLLPHYACLSLAFVGMKRNLNICCTSVVLPCCINTGWTLVFQGSETVRHTSWSSSASNLLSKSKRTLIVHHNDTFVFWARGHRLTTNKAEQARAKNYIAEQSKAGPRDQSRAQRADLKATKLGGLKKKKGGQSNTKQTEEKLIRAKQREPKSTPSTPKLLHTPQTSSNTSKNTHEQSSTTRTPQT